MEQVVIIAFYKFVTLPDYKEIRDPMLAYCKEQDILGSILLAHEGINGTISGSRKGIDAVIAYFRADERFADMDYKTSYAAYRPFDRMKVRLKKEIVTLKAPEADPTNQIGIYVEPQAWNDLIQQDDVILIDTRNEYEYEYGTFRGAINPDTHSFKDFPDYIKANFDPAQNPKIAMFCTGGIRCEKATSYLMANGFKEVYHLKGGILKYLETVPKDDTLWDGDCFVFDNRVALNHDLEPLQTEPGHTTYISKLNFGNKSNTENDE